MITSLLEKTAKRMMAHDKGILAMDESAPTCGKRFQEVNVENTEVNRLVYREMLLSTKGLGNHISACILHDETIHQKNVNGTPLAEVALTNGIIPGIKVDTGAKELAGHYGEKVTEGLDNLRERLTEYRSLGAQFAKWRAVITIGQNIPSNTCIEANAHALARYAALCQEAEMVPIVEPEILLDGTHSIRRCYDVSRETLAQVFEQLRHHDVQLSGMILKASMVLSGKEFTEQASPEEVAKETIRCLRDTVPAAVPGIAFLSGGQSDLQATENLNLINKLRGEITTPWRLTFSYARALQHAALTTWRGDPNNIEAAQAALLHRAKCNSAASEGRYNQTLEQELAA